MPKKRKRKAHPKPKAKKPVAVVVSAAVGWRDIRMTTDEAGAAVKMTGERIRQLTKANWIKRVGFNEYRLGDVIDGVMAYRDDLASQVTADSEQSRLARVRRAEIEQRMAREDGKMVPIEEVAAGITDILGAYRFELSGVAAASTRDLDVRAAIESNLNGAIERCRGRFEAMEGDLRAGREVKLDGDETDA